MATELPEVLILGHHKIGPIPEGYWESWYYVPERVFADQLRLLRERGYAFIDLKTFLDGIDRPEILPPKAALITFDDAYQSLLRYAVPVMQAARCPGVVFVPTWFVGGTNGFDEGKEPLERICSWEDLAAMERGGVAVQSHGVHHRALGELTPEELEIEIGHSKREIEEHLKRPVELYSFAFGDNSKEPEAVEAILRKYRYRAAVLYGGAPVPFTPQNRYRITRIAMGSTTDLAHELDSL